MASNNMTNKSNQSRLHPQAVEKKGILVLGMHRSGSSAMTRVLNLLGCALSDVLIPGGEGNEQGHWEAREALMLNEDMLASAGSAHDDWGAINTDWRASGIRQQMIQRASAVLTDHAMQGPLFALKDPRMCRLADVWIEAAIDAGIEPLILIMLRNPLEVAASLETRDLITTGYSELMWLRHVLDSEFFSRGHKRTFFRYDQLMDNWQSLIGKVKNELDVALPRNSPRVHSEINQFLSHSHRHHKVDAAALINDPAYSVWLRETFRIMLAWSENGENVTDYITLDEVRAELDRAYGTFARLLLTTNVTGEVGSGGRMREQLKVLEQKAVQQAEALRLAKEATEGERATAQKHYDNLAAEQLARVDVENQKAAAEHYLQEQRLQHAELVGQVTVLQSTIVQRQEELAQLLTRFQEIEHLRLCAEIGAERERGQRIELEQRIDKADDQINEMHKQLRDSQRAAEEKVDSLTSDLAQLTILLKTQEDKSADAAEYHQLSEQIVQLGEAVSAAEAARTRSERKLAARFAEIAHLTTIAADETWRADASEDRTQWLRNVLRTDQEFPIWWALMPGNWRRRQAHRRYRRAGLFDGEAYLALYPDVAAHGIDPMSHYILHGMAEGRQRPC